MRSWSWNTTALYWGWRPTCSATAKKRWTSPRKSSSGLPHAAPLPWPVGAPHLDLPHRRQSGPQPAALVEATAAPSQVSLDEHIATHGEMAARDDAHARSGAGREGAGATALAALDQLPFDQRTAMVLREIDGLSYEEIAFSLGVTSGTVKSRLTRARQALREELGDLRC